MPVITISRERRSVDWFRVLADLNRCGQSCSGIGAHIGVAHSTVLGWKQGAEPKYGDGDLLLELWANATGLDRMQPPRITDQRCFSR